MKFCHLFFLSMLSCFVICQIYAESSRIINNSNLTLKTGYDVPIYSRADTQITPIKSQEELQDLLYEAILSNSTQEIMQVVNAGADVNRFKEGKAPLLWATLYKKFNSVEVLKKCGAVIPCAKNMLYRGIMNDSVIDIKSAIAAGADVNDPQISKESSSPLGLAVFLAKPKAVQVLIEAGAKKAYISKLISDALLKGDLKTALILLKHSDKNITKISIKNQDILEYTLNHIDPAGIKDLLFEFLQELINRGYNINAASFNHSIVNNTVRENKNGWVSAIYSPFYSIEVLKLFMKNGANPNQLIYQNGLIFTPLMLGIQNNNINVVKFLLEVGADVNQKAKPAQIRHPRENNQQTPLSYARTFKHYDNQEVINLLIKYNAKA